MVTKLKVLFFCLYISPSPVHAAEFCTVKELSDTLISKRTRIIQFPEGREITIVGNSHGNAGNVAIMKELLAKNTGSASVFSKGLSEILAMESGSVQDQNEDLIFLKRLLSQKKNIKFVGIETPRDAVVTESRDAVKFQKKIERQIKKWKIPPSADYRNAVLLAANAPIYLKMIEPETFKGRELTGFESEAAIKENWLAAKAISDVNIKLRKIQPSLANVIIKCDKYLWGQYTTYVPGAKDEQILDYIKSSAPFEHREIILEWARSQLREMSAFKRREKIVVQGILSRNQSGILFIGTLHLDSVAQQLKEMCDSQISAPDKKSLNKSRGFR